MPRRVASRRAARSLALTSRSCLSVRYTPCSESGLFLSLAVSARSFIFFLLSLKPPREYRESRYVTGYRGAPQCVPRLASPLRVLFPVGSTRLAGVPRIPRPLPRDLPHLPLCLLLSPSPPTPGPSCPSPLAVPRSPCRRGKRERRITS